MHIDGTRLGLRTFAPWKKSVTEQARQFAGCAPLGTFGDSLKISDLGKRLQIRSEETTLCNDKTSSNNADPALKLMDETISKLGETLEEMRKISVLAEDTDLSDSDRIRLQMRMRGLQENAKKDIWSMGLKMAGKSGSEAEALAACASNLVFEQGGGYYGMPTTMEGQENPDMLQRALTRAKNGQEWDVAEVMESVDQLSEVKVIQGPSISVEGSWDDSQLPDEVDPDAPRMYVAKAWKTRYKVVDDPEELTVRQRLEADPRVILIMDPKSAVKATERIDREIETLKELRKDLSSVIAYGSTIGGETEGNANQPESRFRVSTSLGIMVATQDKPGDFRLTEPIGAAGNMFAHLDSTLKNQIARRLGIVAPDGYSPELYRTVHTFV
ncbi:MULTISPECIES: hypothetical protein [Dethiosulfovibrio]|uniref:Flagellin N-terminal domain-containing protein n=2 Tax=Dethiosulfovibrio TaxID=47054 RepID=A0ABS9EQ49_9BACT|nr:MULTISPECIES: hypothetical protein [Dethiosulfovibrio]MCF4114326.1 hypothetical protein [Dethiosulfovibrio russensis]MCF4143318.1 hypothetical protein [Dethiosulfovibrio marinus]MCF4145487.1 hypothetical protein [Dethiosulfovibrio acidaminovorans]